jgi:hypothetical protein
MEAGSRWPAWIGPAAVGSLVLQAAREPTLEFASRAMRAIEQARSTHGVIRTLVLAAGPRVSEDVFTARCLVCRAAVASMEQRKPCLLVFSGHDKLPAEARHELLSLAGALTLSLPGTRIGIRVKLDDISAFEHVAHDPERSGVFERADGDAIIQEAVS